MERLPTPGPAPDDKPLRITAPQDEEADTGGGRAPSDALDALAQGKADRAFFVPSSSSASPTGRRLRAFPFPPPVALPLAAHPAPTIVYPGSFNPLHEGHHALAQAAQALVKQLGGGRLAPASVLYEIAAVNADKGAVDRATLEARLPQFAERGEAAVLTRSPLFVEKARIFPGAYFLIGADTVKVSQLGRPWVWSGGWVECVCSGGGGGGGGGWSRSLPTTRARTPNNAHNHPTPNTPKTS